MILRYPSKNNRNIWNEVDKSDEFEYILVLNYLFEQIESKIEIFEGVNHLINNIKIKV